jgi:multisubunit Na+/H+ antiporter MnhG subunit
MALIGVVVAWRATAGAARVVTAGSVFIAVGIVSLMAVYFVVAGGSTFIMAVLMVLAAVMIGMIGRAVLQPPSRAER